MLKKKIMKKWIGLAGTVLILTGCSVFGGDPPSENDIEQTYLREILRDHKEHASDVSLKVDDLDCLRHGNGTDRFEERIALYECSFSMTLEIKSNGFKQTRKMKGVFAHGDEGEWYTNYLGLSSNSLR